MRTIDPFLAPGLWGGAAMQLQSTMTGGQCSSPRQRPAVTAPPPMGAPLASLAGSVLGPRFHAWYGRSGRRTICSVYPVRRDEAGLGLPDFTWAIVIAASRDQGARDQGPLRSLAVFAFGEGEDKTTHAVKAVADGALEWHVHLLAQDELARYAVLQDLTGA